MGPNLTQKLIAHNFLIKEAARMFLIFMKTYHLKWLSFRRSRNVIYILGLRTTQACAASPVLGFNTEERAWIRDKDINGLTDKRTLRSEARSPGQHRSSHCAPTTAPRRRRACRTKRQAPLLGKRGRLLIKGKLTAGWLISYQGNQQRGAHASAPC